MIHKAPHPLTLPRPLPSGPETGRRGMRAVAGVRTALVDGRTALPVLQSAPPLTLRQTGPHTVHLISTAAGPLGGDHFELNLDIAAGTTLEVASVASTLVLPGDGKSLMRVTARVADGATLHFLPEPTVLAAGCDHRMEVSLTLEGNAQVWWREEIILGRYGEAPGRCHTRFDATANGRPLLRQELTTGDARFATSPAVYDSATCIGTLLLAGAQSRPARTPRPSGAQSHSAGPHTHNGISHVADGVAVLPLAGPGTLVSALARDAVKLRERLAWGQARVDQS